MQVTILQKIALDIKIIPQLLAAVENDQPILTGSLPTLLAITGLIRDMEGRYTLGSHAAFFTPFSFFCPRLWALFIHVNARCGMYHCCFVRTVNS